MQEGRRREWENKGGEKRAHGKMVGECKEWHLREETVGEEGYD